MRGAGVVALLLLAIGSPALAIEVPGSKGRLTVGGYLDGLAVPEIEGAPSQDPQALLSLQLDGRITRALRVRAEVRGRVGGPFRGGHPGLFNFVHEFQNYSPSLEARELYGEWRGRHAEVRAGLQTFAWGRLDGIPPTDVVNPRDYHDPLLQDFEERKVGVPALSAVHRLASVSQLGLDQLRAQAVWLPLAVPPRLPLLEERWFPPTVRDVRPLVISGASVARALGVPAALPDVDIPIGFHTRSDRPGYRLNEGGIALRLAGAWRDFDFDLYHYTGPTTEPDVDLRFVLRVTRFDATNLARTRVVGDTELRQAHDTTHMTGADVATRIGGATVRAEGAWFIDRPFQRAAADLLSPASIASVPLRPTVLRLLRTRRAPLALGDLFPTEDCVEWGVGADYLVAGFLPIVQVNQTIFLEDTPRLLAGDPDTRFTGVVRRQLLDERLELEIRGVYAVERQSWFVLPRASYKLRDDLRLRLGYLALGGERESIIGQFKRNDEVVLQARYTF